MDVDRYRADVAYSKMTQIDASVGLVDFQSTDFDQLPSLSSSKTISKLREVKKIRIDSLDQMLNIYTRIKLRINTMKFRGERVKISDFRFTFVRGIVCSHEFFKGSNVYIEYYDNIEKSSIYSFISCGAVNNEEILRISIAIN